jgi:hypothetical protein
MGLNRFDVDERVLVLDSRCDKYFVGMPSLVLVCSILSSASSLMNLTGIVSSVRICTTYGSLLL